jgi:formylglycine-generating enzyme required for sulfatase activity
MVDVNIKQLKDVVIGSYRLDELLGAGGFGAVYRAVVVLRGERMGRAAAIKVLNPAGLLPEDPLRELRLAFELEHEYLLKVLGPPGEAQVRDANGGSGTVFWFAMELAEETLHDRLNKGPLPEAEMVTMLRAVGQALAFLHGQKERLVHRDIKPTNILRVVQNVGTNDKPMWRSTWKLGDLGLTRAEVDGPYRAVRGTECYLPPESHDTAEVKATWDVWAYGLTLVEAATGQQLWRGMSPRQWTNVITSDHEFDLPPLPVGLAEIARGCLAKAPQQRWTIVQVLQALAPEAATARPSPRNFEADTGAPEAVQLRQRVLPDAAKVVGPPPVDDRWKGWLIGGVGLILLMGWGVWPTSYPATGGKPDTTAERPTAPVSDTRPQVTVIGGSYPQPGSVFRDVQTNGSACGDCPEMVVIPKGSFTMGSPEAETSREKVSAEYAAWERPQHLVTVPSFALAKNAVTRGEFAAFVQATGYDPKGCYVFKDGKWGLDQEKSWRNPGFAQTDRHPVVCVSWQDAQRYTSWLNSKVSGGLYRLPSEAEWEYAARAGTTTARFWGDDREQACVYANVSDLTAAEVNNFDKSPEHTFQCRDGYGQTAPVGSFRSNPFGLNDMLGNVWQWAEDTWHGNYQGAPTDGSAWTTGDSNSARVVRGGCWVDLPSGLRSANRYSLIPGGRNDILWFPAGEDLTS